MSLPLHVSFYFQLNIRVLPDAFDWLLLKARMITIVSRILCTYVPHLVENYSDCVTWHIEVNPRLIVIHYSLLTSWIVTVIQVPNKCHQLGSPSSVELFHSKHYKTLYPVHQKHCIQFIKC